ncbi:GFA family protein [Acinetobacter bouvetii]|uniref:Glutathione-dependent formaldehyde-activating enzyme n=1 Tax=Acinetobacter bouvetii TaxID=202951 RepID=A0A811GDU2_9GAMM|nr:GFA family protein [Acinetobacter bouvetii]CAB1221782.1 Putative glutathione-dependent formaldehyde-activating enzyme [Acinetobacter bouvetii]
MYKASCLCGGVQIRIKQEIQNIYVCYCKQCQKAQGSAFVAIAPIDLKNLQIYEGQM